MKPAVLLLCAATMQAQQHFCVTSYPVSPKISALILGDKELFLWDLFVTETTAPVSRIAIVTRLPFAPLTHQEAIDVIDRKASTSFWGTVGAYWSVVSDTASAGMAYAAARSSDIRVKGGLLAAAGLLAIAGPRVRARKVDTSDAKARLLPDAGVPGEWEGLIIGGTGGVGKVGPVCQ